MKYLGEINVTAEVIIELEEKKHENDKQERSCRVKEERFKSN